MDTSAAGSSPGLLAFQLQYMAKIGQMMNDQTQFQGAQAMQLLESAVATSTPTVDPTSSVGQNIDTYA